MTLFSKTASELQSLLHNKEVSVKDLTEESFKRIEQSDDDVQAFLALDKENALQKAEKLDETSTDNKSALFGLPIGIKDNIVTKGLETTAASRMLEGFVPVFDATIVGKIEDAGMITVGKLNLDEFAMGSTTETSAFQKTKNPWNLEHVPGGSSGGSAAAVAAGQVPFSLGTDTGGSIRQPAAYCGIVGMKPTYGRVSRLGVVALAGSLDQAGPMTRNVTDNALLLHAIAGLDPKDSSSSAKEVLDYQASLKEDIKGLKIGVPKEYLGEGVSEDVKKAVQEALKVLESLGAEVEEISLPHATYAPSTYNLLCAAEASSSLARYDGVHYGYRTEHAESLDDLYRKSRAEGFGGEVKRRILLGTHVLGADYYDSVYKKAQQARRLIAQDLKDAFEKYDVIIGPAAATTAPKLGAEKDAVVNEADDRLATPANLAGVPALSIPCGFSNDLPIGLQIIGNHFDEATVYKVAYAYEQATDFHTRTPAIWEGK